MIFAYASLVTHQLFRTDPRDMSKNNTSSYLDLSVLYGTNQDQQDLVRDKAKGLGLLHPDAFAEDRLVLVPPAATALLVLFSRNHNVSQIIVPDGAKLSDFFFIVHRGHVAQNQREEAMVEPSSRGPREAGRPR